VIRSLFATCRMHGAWCSPGACAGAIWLGAVLLVFGLLYRHTYQPNKVPTLPANEEAMEASSHFQVKLFAHPHCPCTRASLEQFGESLTRFPADVQAEIIFVTAGLAESEIASSPRVLQARELPRAQVRFDATGEEAKRWGATVSGEVLAFDARGRLVFRGGITSGRGHQGGSTGQVELENIVNGRSPGPCATPVFGCHLPTP
jgi:hypothetical protein